MLAASKQKRRRLAAKRLRDLVRVRRLASGVRVCSRSMESCESLYRLTCRMMRGDMARHRRFPARSQDAPPPAPAAEPSSMPGPPPPAPGPVHPSAPPGNWVLVPEPAPPGVWTPGGAPPSAPPGDLGTKRPADWGESQQEERAAALRRRQLYILARRTRRDFEKRPSNGLIGSFLLEMHAIRASNCWVAYKAISTTISFSPRIRSDAGNPVSGASGERAEMGAKTGAKTVAYLYHVY